MTDLERAQYFEKQMQEMRMQKDQYKAELAQTQEILGRTMVQLSERWDTVKLTNYPRKKLN